MKIRRAWSELNAGPSFTLLLLDSCRADFFDGMERATI
jgi:hypothetical protein